MGELIKIPGGQFVAKTIGLGRKLAQEWAFKNVPGEVTNEATGWAITVSKSGLDKATSGPRNFPQDHLEAVAALPQLLRGAKLTESRLDRANDPNIKAIRIFNESMAIGNTEYFVKLTVKETRQGRFFYDHSLKKLERPAGTSRSDANGRAVPGPQTGPKTKIP